MNRNTLLIQPKSSTELTDLSVYSCVCLEIPPLEPSETQEVSSQEWYGEAGEDAYIPQELKMKAFDWEVKCGIKASSASTLTMYYEEMIHLLTHNGMLKMYSPYLELGKDNVYLKSVKDKEQFIDDSGMSVITFTLSFRITDPESNVTPNDNDSPTRLN